MTAHTPGPWKVEGDALDVRDAEGDNIVTVKYGDDPERAEANARLIASAPQLLAALKLTLDTIKGLDPKTYDARISYEKGLQALAAAEK